MNLVQEVDQRPHSNGDLGTGPRQVVALYDYDPLKDSLNSDGGVVELAFRAGDVITVYGKARDGFIQVR